MCSLMTRVIMLAMAKLMPNTASMLQLGLWSSSVQTNVSEPGLYPSFIS